ncbi:MAG: MgtC/SapB family protein [Sphingomonadaceae bacterium]
MIANLATGEMSPILLLGLALAIGLLIGLERGWAHRKEEPGSRVAGIRTFGILGLLGGVAGELPLVLALVLILAISATLLAGYVRQRFVTPNVSATTTLVGLLTVALGYLTTTGNPLGALAASVATTLLLSMREQIHGWMKGLTSAEVQAIGRFGLLAAVILPLLPDAQYGPLAAWNPRHIFLVVVFVSGFSLVGYVATKRLGMRAGLLITAFTGALVSSTAVTLSLARKLKDGSADLPGVAAGIAVASCVMLLRVILLTAVLAPFAAWILARLLLPALVIAIIIAALVVRRSQSGSVSNAPKVANPFDIKPALALAGLVAIIALAVRWAELHFGDAGIAIMLALTGFADVDAAVMALSTLPQGSIGAREAGMALAAPVLLNTALKGGLTIGACPDRRGITAALPLFIAVIAALISVVWSFSQ